MDFKILIAELFSETEVSGRAERHPDQVELAVLDSVQSNCTAQPDNPMGKIGAQWFV